MPLESNAEHVITLLMQSLAEAAHFFGPGKKAMYQ